MRSDGGTRTLVTAWANPAPKRQPQKRRPIGEDHDEINEGPISAGPKVPHRTQRRPHHLKGGTTVGGLCRRVGIPSEEGVERQQQRNRKHGADQHTEKHVSSRPPSATTYSVAHLTMRRTPRLSLTFLPEDLWWWWLSGWSWWWNLEEEAVKFREPR